MGRADRPLETSVVVKKRHSVTWRVPQSAQWVWEIAGRFHRQIFLRNNTNSVTWVKVELNGFASR